MDKIKVEATKRNTMKDWKARDATGKQDLQNKSFPSASNETKFQMKNESANNSNSLFLLLKTNET
jgi:hypothetical protein